MATDPDEDSDFDPRTLDTLLRTDTLTHSEAHSPSDTQKETHSVTERKRLP